MEKRPHLNRHLDSKAFRSYYYLKEELVAFCREHSIPASGGKMELTDRIADYLDTGTIKPVQAKPKLKSKAPVGRISETMEIEPDFVCSEKHRAFFHEKIGAGFSFNVAFQKWLKTNAGKTYAQAIEAYQQILEKKKTGKTTIDKQFEYNTYIRDFFADNQGAALKDAIECWNHKKGKQGHNRYEKLIWQHWNPSNDPHKKKPIKMGFFLWGSNRQINVLIGHITCYLFCFL